MLTALASNQAWVPPDNSAVCHHITTARKNAAGIVSNLDTNARVPFHAQPPGPAQCQLLAHSCLLHMNLRMVSCMQAPGAFHKSAQGPSPGEPPGSMLLIQLAAWAESSSRERI